MKSAFLPVGIIALGLVCMGAGCSRQADAPAPMQQPAVGVRAFRTGDMLVYEEPAAVVDGKRVDGPVVRRVTLDAYVPAKSSDGSYTLAKTNEPNTILARGTWQNATLNTAHMFYFPGVVDAKTRPVADSSALILGREEIRELINTSGTTIIPRFTEDVAWGERLGIDPAAKRGFTALAALIREADVARKDTTFARQTTSSTVERTLRVNGKDEQVAVYEIRNWFGTYEVLAREDAPVVVAFTLDPQVPKTRLDVTKGDGLAAAQLINFRLKELIYKN